MCKAAFQRRFGLAEASFNAKLPTARAESQPCESVRATGSVHLRSKWRRSRTTLETCSLLGQLVQLGQLQLAHLVAVTPKGARAGQHLGAAWDMAGLTA